MAEVNVQTIKGTRLFLAVPIPEAVVKVLERATHHYPQYIEKALPVENWHLTMVFLGEGENPAQYFGRLQKNLPQTFVPTVSLMHVGRGLQRSQLWAYAHPSTTLLNLRGQLVDRLKHMRFPLPHRDEPSDFVPHVHLADLFPMSRGIGMADYPVISSFAVKEVNLYRSRSTPQGVQYSIEGIINLIA